MNEYMYSAKSEGLLRVLLVSSLPGCLHDNVADHICADVPQ